MIILLKCICLVLAIVYGVSNIMKFVLMLKGVKTHRISTFQLFAMAIGIVGFLCLHVFLKL